MTVVAPARLPRIAFEAVAPPVADPLPRMDIAAFVGFAATGPVHVPVAVEDARDFRDIFGPDVDVAVDHATAEPARSHLGPAVEAFFGNGGRRCWVVRVADEETVGRATVDVPGLVAVDRHGRAVASAQLRAASAGPAATGLAVTALQEIVPLPGRARIGADRRSLVLTGTPGVVTGDLVRLRLGEHEALLFGVVGTEAAAGRIRIAVGVVLRHIVGLPPGTVADVEEATLLGARPRPVTVTLELLPVPTVCGDVGLDDVVSLTPRGGPPLLLVVGPEIADGRHAVAAVHRVEPLDDIPVTGAHRVEGLRVGLRVRRQQQTVGAASGLVADAVSSASWAALPVDETRYGDRSRPAPPRPVPLAGPDALPRDVTWLPLLLPTDPRQARARPLRLNDAAGGDGLDTFHAGLFLDRELAPLGTRLLRPTAEQIAHLSNAPRRLRGVHALLDVEEASLVAVPDVGHPGWRDGPPLAPGAAPEPPRLDPVQLLAPCRARLSWPRVAGAVSVTVEQATSADFRDAMVRHDGPAAGTAVRAVIDLDLPCACRQRLWFRVRVTGGDGQVGPWSVTVSLLVPEAEFDPCAQPPVAPLLRLDAAAEAADATLSWVVPGDAPVEVQRAAEPTFAQPSSAMVAGHELTIARPARGTTFARVRRADLEGTVAAWSNTVALGALPSVRRTLEGPAPGDAAPAALAVHRALLRMCAARGDLVAVLSAAGHHDAAGAQAHVAALADLDATAAVEDADVPPLGRDEDAALGHALLAHPWVLGGAPAGVRVTPPDGAVCGVIARRTIDCGAWLSPGGQRFHGVLGTVPLRDAMAPARLTAAGLNVVARNPYEEVLLTANTLATDDVLRPVGVRRLLILLRRLALRHGATYVFEPNGARFHAMVRRTFEELLSALHQRGALVGSTAAQAYRVVADATVNPPASLDAGRFVIELHVAPAHPLEFIRVRLVQTDPGVLEMAEATT